MPKPKRQRIPTLSGLGVKDPYDDPLQPPVQNPFNKRVLESDIFTQSYIPPKQTLVPKNMFDVVEKIKFGSAWATTNKGEINEICRVLEELLVGNPARTLIISIPLILDHNVDTKLNHGIDRVADLPCTSRNGKRISGLLDFLRRLRQCPAYQRAVSTIALRRYGVTASVEKVTLYGGERYEWAYPFHVVIKEDLGGVHRPFTMSVLTLAPSPLIQ